MKIAGVTFAATNHAHINLAIRPDAAFRVFDVSKAGIKTMLALKPISRTKVTLSILKTMRFVSYMFHN